PLMVRLFFGSENRPATVFAIGAALGTAAGIFLAIDLVRRMLTAHDRMRGPAQWLLPLRRLRRIPRILGAGYIDYGRGLLLPGPFWLIGLLILAVIGCLVSEWHINRLVERDLASTLLPTLAYVEIVIIVLTFF